MNVWGILLKCAGWKTDISVPYRDKAVICVAPHTSNWDFIAGLVAYRSMGRKASFLMKEFWFFFPLKYILKAFGGIPVKKKSDLPLTSVVIEDFKTFPRLNLALTPEGTRSAVNQWKTGFLTIAYGAGVPIQLGVIDYKNKIVFIKKEYYPSGNYQQDMEEIRNYYVNYKSYARYPEKFIP